MVQLICEGPCNPAIQNVDDLVSVAARERNLIGVRTVMVGQNETLLYQRGDAALWNLQSHLRYTPHEELAQDYATCLTCGHVRRYGRTVQSVPFRTEPAAFLGIVRDKESATA